MKKAKPPHLQKEKITIRLQRELVPYMEKEATRLGFTLAKFASLLTKRGLNSYKEQRREEAHEEASYTRWCKGYYDKL